jgi:hypothetical protein
MFDDLDAHADTAGKRQIMAAIFLRTSRPPN